MEASSQPQRSDKPHWPLVKINRAQSLRERWNSLKREEGPRGPPRQMSSSIGKNATGTGARPHTTSSATPQQHKAAGGPSHLVGFIKRNSSSSGQTQQQQQKQQLPKSSMIKHKNYGVVPKYMKMLRETLLERQRAQAAEAREKSLPPGLRRLSEDERLKLLTFVLQQKEKAETELHALPIATKTQRQQLRYDELSRLLVSLDKQLLKLSNENLLVEKEETSSEVSAAPAIPVKARWR